jgi:hypothetical protein
MDLRTRLKQKYTPNETNCHLALHRTKDSMLIQEIERATSTAIMNKNKPEA